MIYVNNKMISPEGTSKFSKEIAAGFKAIKKRGFPVIFNVNPNRITTSKLAKGGTVKEWNKHFIPYRTTISGFSGSEKWVYTRNPPSKKDGNLVFKNNGRMVYKKFFALGMDDIELIFFLEYKCPLIKNGSFLIENKAAEAAEKAQKLTSDVEVQYMIYGEGSPLSSFPRNLRALAAAWGVINVLEKNAGGEYIVDLNMVKNDLFDAVKDGERRKERGFEEFMDSIKTHKLTDKRAVIQQAIDRKLIKYISKEYRYIFLDTEGNDVGTICRITPQQIGKKVEALNDYLNLHEYEMDLLTKAVKHGDESNEPVVVRVEKPERTDIQAMDFHAMAEEAKKCKGVRYTGVGKEALRKSLMEHYEYV